MKKAIVIALAVACAALVTACENEEADFGNLNVVVCDEEPGTFCGGDQPVRPGR